MGKATDEFRKRDDGKGGPEDGRQFHSWYHIDDVKRILWGLFTRLPAKSRALFLQPQVMFDGIYQRNIGDILNITADWFRKTPEEVRYFPFIFKPELGGVHYLAGVFVKVAALGMKLVLFNPAGHIKHINIDNLDKLIDVHVSPHALQTAKKDGGKLVSCGPLSLYFLEYILNHPNWLETLDNEFTLPEVLSQFNEESTYKDDVLKLRQAHDRLLQTVSDEDVKKVEAFYEPFDDMLLKALDVLDKKRERERLLESYDDYASVHSDSEPFDPDFSEDGVSDDEEGEEVGEALTKSEKMLLETPVIKPHSTARSLTDKRQPVTGQSDGEQPPTLLLAQTAVEIAQQSDGVALTKNDDSASMDRPDVLVVRAEIQRLRGKTGIFSWGCADKSNRIEQALIQASTETSDVRLNGAVRTALAAHRIGFFGQAQSLINIDESLAKEAIQP
ncbi:hypothetical protein [Legionella erythra]|uniref:Uncharacterized protein n=1 Tax=Legionella erythra TaxID=448 RepID=A0A0W0TV07_LEGER|nr:hypothetical protein [Legionella erythra]KTC99449.1 hypothetical protein Lery_0350 [Legionella erythra]